MKKKLLIFLAFLILSGVIIINFNYTEANLLEDDNINDEEYININEFVAGDDGVFSNTPNTDYVNSNANIQFLFKKSAYPENFDLRDLIPKNTGRMFQKGSKLCWTFTTMDILETTLALKDYYNGKEPETKYDFSEINSAYALTTNYFLNDEINENGLNRLPNQGGSGSLGIDLLTSIGVVNESYMPFEEWYETLYANDKIDIDYIKNRKVEVQVLDTIDFPVYNNAATTLTTEEFQQLNNKVKNHLMNYGGIYLSMSSELNNTLNGTTKAIYCDNLSNCTINHSLTIIGWDDNYSKENFLSNRQPKNNGAWIVNNSMGYGKEDLNYLREQVRDVFCQISRNVEECKKNGWDENPNLITNEALDYTIVLNKYIINYEDNTAVLDDDGIYYISYEDASIYSGLKGIEKATTSLTYDNLYQHNIASNLEKEFETNTENKIYISDVFQRTNTNKKEYLSSISMYAAETNTVKVYVNPNGDSIKKEDLILIKLKSGDSETFNAGYHTLEFSELLELNSDEFAVVLEIQGTRDNKILLKVEGAKNASYYSKLHQNGVDGEGAYSKDFENWISYSDYTLDSTNKGVDTTIKAFTISNVEKLEIQGTVKTIYTEGDNFDINNLKVFAIYKGDYKIEITDYNLLNGTNLALNQDEVTINYGDIDYKISITVNEKDKEENEYLEFDSSLSIDEENSIINNVISGTIFQDVLDKISTNGNISILGKNDNVVEDITDKKIGTGYKFKIELPSQTVQYILSVRGDVTGDGVVNINDVVGVSKHVIKGNYLQGLEYIYASDIDENDQVNINDVIKLAKYIINNSYLQIKSEY